MSIQDTFSFDKDGEVVRFSWVKRFFLSLVIILVGLLSFGLGRLSGQGNGAGEVKISYDQSDLALPSAIQSAAAVTSGAIVASSNGKKYYYPGCTNNISDKNKITFTNYTAAEASGYTLAANCQKP
jgi:hypothetical protein